MMMIMMSLCRDIGVFRVVVFPRENEARRRRKKEKKEKKRGRASERFFASRFGRVFVCDKSVFGILYLSRNHSLFFFSQYYYYY
tara:strand:+ start:61 stop:312 length:252 start_codon:yes stop_codon:yes gene_type:complete